MIELLMTKEEFNELFLNISFPEWMRSTKPSHDFRGFIIDKHTITERLIELLITAHYFSDVTLTISESFIENVLSLMDFSKKVSVLQSLDLIDSDLASKIYEVNRYRVAQAHIKRGDTLREPSQANIDKFTTISIEVHSKLSQLLMLADFKIKEKVEEVVKDMAISG